MIFPGSTWHRGIDLIAVERAMSGRGGCPELTDEELRYTADEMTSAGMSAVVIGERLGIAARTVTRWREGANDGNCRGGCPDVSGRSSDTRAVVSGRAGKAGAATSTDTCPHVSGETCPGVSGRDDEDRS